jgi:ABC-type Na+ efflux pump permease subunit
MTILPLVQRELRVKARSPSCYWMRFAAALGGILVCAPAVMISGGLGSGQAQMGAFAFDGLVLAAFILCCGSGLTTVDGISRERREGTLGLLFLTRVRVVDVLVGKFGAAGLTGLCALAACVPVLIVPILTGGVSGAEAARKVLVLFDTMAMSLATGLWASARGRGW